MADNKDWLPWYRRKGYKGNLTEAEKQILDSFRMSGTHPAARYEQLPEEVQRYINRLEMELYDKKQHLAAVRVLVLTGVVALVTWLLYKGYGYSSSPFAYLFVAVLLIVAWAGYRREWKKNANDLYPEGIGASIGATDEELRYEWELEYIVRHKHRNDAEERELDA